MFRTKIRLDTKNMQPCIHAQVIPYGECLATKNFSFLFKEGFLFDQKKSIGDITSERILRLKEYFNQMCDLV